MASLRGFCARTLLVAALVSGATPAGFFKPERNRLAPSELQVQAANKAADSSYGTSACKPGTPQFPNYIQPMKIDPSRMMGKWYYYMDWFNGRSGSGTTVNIIATWTNLLNGSLTLYPGSNTQAVAFEQMYGSYVLVDSQCNTVPPANYLYYLTVDGQLRGIGMSNGSADIDGSSVVSTDYDTYVVIFECNTYDTKSGFCFEPYIYVQTRDRPDKLSGTTVSNIVSAVNQALGPYCFAADMLIESRWLSDKPECPPNGVTDACYLSIRNAYLYLADPNFNG